MEKDRDIATLEKMAELYCKGLHKNKGGELCPSCQAVLDYAIKRRDLCPYGDDKPFCAYCKTKCYKPNHQEKIREIMRYSGWRLLFYKPQLVLAHTIEGWKYRKKIDSTKIK